MVYASISNIGGAGLLKPVRQFGEVIRRFRNRFGSGELGLIERGDFRFSVRILDAKSFAQLVAKSLGGTVKSFAVNAPGRKMPLNQLAALAIELLVALLFRESPERVRTDQSADVYAITPRFEVPHRFGELARSLFQYRRSHYTQLLNEWVNFRPRRHGSCFLFEAQIHRLCYREQQPEEFRDGHDEVRQNQNAGDSRSDRPGSENSMTVPQDIEDGDR